MRLTLEEAGWPESRAQGELGRAPRLIGLGGDWICEHERGRGERRVDTLFTSPCGSQRAAVELKLGNVDTDHLTRLLEYAEREAASAVLVVEDCSGIHGRLANCLIRAELMTVFCMHVERARGDDRLVLQAHDPGHPPRPTVERDFEAEWKRKPNFDLVEYLLSRVMEADEMWLPAFRTHIGGCRIDPQFNCVAVHSRRKGVYEIEIKLPKNAENDRAVTAIFDQWSYKHQGRPRREHYRIKVDAAWDHPRLKRLGDLLVCANRRWRDEGIAR